MTDLEKLGALLREMRGEQTLKQIAKALDLNSPQTVGNWERGYQLPPEAKIDAIKAAYAFGAAPTKADEFERLYSELRKQKNATGPLTLADQGVKPMVDGLRELAQQARTDKEHRFILHSVSNQAFLTESVPGLQAAVLECAEAGVDIVFFPQPGAETPMEVQGQLIKSLKAGMGNYKVGKARASVDYEQLKKRFWFLSHAYSPPTFPMPVAEEELDEWSGEFVRDLNGEASPAKAKKVSGLVQCVSAAASWLGSFLRLIIEIKVPRSASEGDVLSRICPDDFEFERLWLHFVTYNPDTQVKNHAWLHIADESGRFAVDYGRELAGRKNAGLLKGEPLFKQ